MPLTIAAILAISSLASVNIHMATESWISLSVVPYVSITLTSHAELQANNPGQRKKVLRLVLGVIESIVLAFEPLSCNISRYGFFILRGH